MKKSLKKTSLLALFPLFYAPSIYAQQQQVSVPSHNIASAAHLIAKNTTDLSNADNPEHPLKGAVDQVISGYPQKPKAEWATRGVTTGAELCLTWSRAVPIQKINLYDRVNASDQITSGEIVTDTGKVYPVPELRNDGKTPTEIKLDGSPVKQITFRVKSVSPTTKNAGLAEIEVFSTAPTPETIEQILPRPIYDENPDFLKLYDVAWKFAINHIRYHPELATPRYVDEAFSDDMLWIWDTCFMVMYCRYAAPLVPGVESLKNFYAPILEGVKSPIGIQMIDNPPLFAWVEYDTFKMTADRKRIDWLLHEKQYLQKYYTLLDELDSVKKYPNFWQVPNEWIKKNNGFLWSGGHSGMDNTPRGRGAKHGALWLDAISQQALSALYISRMAESIGDHKLKTDWDERYQKLKTIINERYWDKVDGCYYDIDSETGEFCRVRTPASFWPLLAEVASPEQAAKMAEKVRDPQWFGGKNPWPSLAPTDQDFNKDHGEYWRGAVWLPLVYMGTKALDKYGYHDLARETATRTLEHMNRTYQKYSPSTIWECYSPTADKPSSYHGHTVRPDFCGWSALGPISILIEDLIGIQDIDANKRTVTWHLVSPERTGVENLRFADVITNLVAERNGTVVVKSTQPYTLIINKKIIPIKRGVNQFQIKRAISENKPS